jgi:hypothetical protein
MPEGYLHLTCERQSLAGETVSLSSRRRGFGWASPHNRSQDDPGERSQDDIGGKDKRQEQRPTQIAPGSGGGQRGAYVHVTHL